MSRKKNNEGDTSGRLRLIEFLAILGWSQRSLSRRLGRKDALVRNWLNGAVPVPCKVLVWLQTLVAFHQDNPPPW